MPLNERARHSPKFIFGRVGAGVAQLGVSRRGRRFVVRASRSLRGAKKHRTAAVFRVSVASHLPARIPIVGPICAMGCAALSACDRRNFTSVISRPAPEFDIAKHHLLLRNDFIYTSRAGFRAAVRFCPVLSDVVQSDPREEA